MRFVPMGLVIPWMYVSFTFLPFSSLDGSLTVTCYIAPTSSTSKNTMRILDSYRHYPPTNPLPSILPHHSNPAYIDHEPGSPFIHIMHRILLMLSTFLSRRVNRLADAPGDDDSSIYGEDYLSPPPSPNPG
ncbi:uncharacterized protein BJ212DRAFT_1365156 [Suillus subaureus]|uniref:Secreted protein n=1 Tax=Suillus subaureus TaxID=48587 RepID=A0A9P7E877_9AGAM|nr:uncharacterized protein BJ212DRAFT_1365156 [Suillus subaureus]KAG1814019.1 hypothetical protein BJ212DRAFT_1365156 [Suillus subaureus]